MQARTIGRAFWLELVINAANASILEIPLIRAIAGAVLVVKI
jgi:hypothetical protein